MFYPKNISLNKNLFNKLVTYFIKGVLLIVPFIMTGYIISMALNWVDSIIKIKIPGLGIAIVLLAIILFGYLGSTLFMSSTFVMAEKFIIKVPLIGMIYTSLKELIAAFVGNKKKFDKPVLVQLDQQMGLKRLGFITQKEMKALDILDYVAVYIPHSYSFSGDLYLVPKTAVIFLSNVSGTEVMKFIISGGVTALKNLAEEAAAEAAAHKEVAQ